MRTIKFRFFDGKKMCEVGELTFFADNAGYHINGEFPSTGKDPFSLMQFTGLLDKSGKEIYEGDIVKYLVHYPRDYQERNPKKKFGRIAGPVQWTKGWLYLDYDGEDNGDNALLYEKEAENWEIIGNIYENPDLLNPTP